MKTLADIQYIHTLADNLWSIAKEYSRGGRLTPLTHDESDILKAACTHLHQLAEAEAPFQPVKPNSQNP